LSVQSKNKVFCSANIKSLGNTGLGLRRQVKEKDNLQHKKEIASGRSALLA
jgi:hypothetical protein